MTWLDLARDLDALDVAHALGMPPAKSERVLAQCPACGAEGRSRKEPRRPPVDVNRGKGAWHCKACNVGGGVLDLAAYRLERAPFRDLSATGKDRVHDWFSDRFGLPARRGGVAVAPSARQVAPMPKRAPRPEQPPVRPPAAEVAAVWSGCREVTQDAEVAGWLASRAIGAERVMELELAKALPKDAAVLPAWAALGTPERPETARSWAVLGYRCLVPLYDASGALVSLRARSVTGGAPKAVPPTGNHLAPPVHYAVRGLVMANPVGRRVLQGGRAPNWWPSGKPLVVWVAEGETDFLAIASQWTIDDPEHPAVFGVESGAWVPEIAARIPFGSVVVVATDDDPAGEKYAAKVIETLSGRVKMRRWTVERAKRAVRA